MFGNIFDWLFCVLGRCVHWNQDHESQRQALASWAATLSRSGVPQMRIRQECKYGAHGATFARG